MKSYDAHLRLAKGNPTKACRTYCAERKWFGDEWYAAWETGLADEVELACRKFQACEYVARAIFLFGKSFKR